MANENKAKAPAKIEELQIQIPEGKETYGAYAGKTVGFTTEALKKTDVKWMQNHYHQEFGKKGNYTLAELAERPGVLVAAQYHYSAQFNVIREVGTKRFKKRFAKA